jgi:predicted TIM-barrel fold metal-dependent hydrolase
MTPHIDINSHIFRCNTDNVERYRRLAADPAVARIVVSGVDLKLPPSADFPYMAQVFSTSNADVLAVVEAVASPKLVPWCYIDPREPDAVTTLESWLRRGMRGVKMYPPIGFNPDDPRAMAVYAAAQAHGLPVFLHMGRTAAHPNLSSAHARPLFLEQVGLAYPKLTVVIGHFAAPWQDEAWQIAMGFPAFRFDLSTSGGWDPKPLRMVIEHDPVGLGRILFGSNGDGANNLDHAAKTRTRLQQAGFSAAELQAIFQDNGQRLLGSGQVMAAR